MSHLPILPILIAAFAGFALTLCSGASLRVQRGISLTSAALGVLFGMVAVGAATSGPPMVYALGDWPAPFGILLVLDRLSALMVLLTSGIALFALLSAVGGWDTRGRLFHALFQFQLMGIYGAFLTGDIFNLFVFFEILLIASYGLLLHGGGAGRARAGIKYVVVNLTASALFLVAVAALYGATGTLNMADLAERIPQVPAEDMPLVRASAFLFLVVFGTKAALLPLFFWLPEAYARASAPVASLFAIMTKIGVYAILRVFSLAYGAPDGAPGDSVAPWLLWGSLATLAIGMIGALQATSLTRLIAYLTIASVGTMLVGISQFTGASISAALFYMVHSTLAVAGLFLLADPIRQQRGETGDLLVTGPPVAPWATLGLLFLGLAAAIAGIPPLAPFLGKALILQASIGHELNIVIWSTVLVTSLLSLVALARAASLLFWKCGEGSAPATPVRASLLPASGLFAVIVIYTLGAGSLEGYADATAGDLIDSTAYVEAVLSNATVVTVEGEQ